MKPWTPERRKELRRLATAGGMSGEQIAIVLESGRSSIMRELKRMRLKLNGGNRGFRSTRKNMAPKTTTDDDYEFTLEEKAQLVLIAARARDRGEAALAGLTIYKVFVGASLDRRGETDRTVAALRESYRRAHAQGRFAKD